jgi:hypothetical protein
MREGEYVDALIAEYATVLCARPSRDHQSQPDEAGVVEDLTKRIAGIFRLTHVLSGVYHWLSERAAPKPGPTVLETFGMIASGTGD